MATVTATMPLHPFPDKGEETNSGDSDNDVGMSLSPSPSPHTTLTPIEAAELSAQTKEAVSSVAMTEPLHVEGEDVTALLPRPSENMDTFLTVVSQTDMDNGRSNNPAVVEDLTKEQKLEARIAQLEQNLASLMEVCNGLMKKHQVRSKETCFDQEMRELVQVLVREEVERIGLCYRQVRKPFYLKSFDHQQRIHILLYL